MVCGVILIGGPYKQANFAPLDIPAPLMPVAGLEMICHQIYGLSRIQQLKKVFLCGNYDAVQLKNFISQRGKQSGLDLHYLEENKEWGTGGSIAIQIDFLFEDCDDIIVLHSDICSDFPLKDIYEQHKMKNNPCTVMTVQSKNQNGQFGYFVMNTTTNELIHHAEKPDQFLSDLINCGIYIFNKIFREAFTEALTLKQQRVSGYKENQPFLQYIHQQTELDSNYLSLERDIIMPWTGQGKIFLYKLDLKTHFWSQIKTTNDLLRANIKYIEHYSKNPLIYSVFKDIQLQQNNVLRHITAQVGSQSKLGPYVVIGAGVKIGDNVRIKNSVIQAGVEIKSFTYITNSIIGFNSTIGHWCRIEGTNIEDNSETDGKICVLGVGVHVNNEMCVRNSIVLSNKKIQQNCEKDHIL